MEQPTFNVFIKASVDIRLTIELNRRYWKVFDQEDIPGYVSRIEGGPIWVSWDTEEGGAASLDWIKSTIVDLTGLKIVNTSFFKDEIHFRLEKEV